MSDPANPPPDVPARRSNPRSFFGKRANALKAQAKQTDRDAQALASIPIVIGEALDPANTLNSNDVASRPDLTLQPSSRIIKRARELMVSNAEFFVRSHVEIIKQCLALSKVDPRYLDTARRAAEFAITNISADGERVIDKAGSVQPPPSTIQIGIALGGLPARDHKLLEK